MITNTENKLQNWQLKQRQSLPLEIKIKMSILRIRKWYEYFNGNVYVSYSGGKDSTALLKLVRSQYPKVHAVFVNTGLEFPEIISMVKQTENVIWLRTQMNFKAVISKYGYPIISKSVSMAIIRYRNTKSETQKQLRLYGGINPTSGKIQRTGIIPKKYHYLINAPFKISDYCCEIMKKYPIKKFNKASKLKPYVGVMAQDSNMRKINYLQRGCNSFESTNPQSRPIMFWNESDIWNYIKGTDCKYSGIYDMGYSRTGCVFCGFGIMNDKCPNRFQRLKITHPKLYDICMSDLGMEKVLEYVGIEYK